MNITRSHRKRILVRAAAFLTLVCALLLTSCGNRNPYLTEYTDTGCPLLSDYPLNVRARSVWDMYVHEGKLYVGSGDYENNAGPVKVWAYDLTTRLWENTGELPDEEISRFLVIDGSLTVPGLDPKDDWSFGNYYRLNGGSWEVRRCLPGAVHAFDMIEYDGKIFAGIGTDKHDLPICFSTDGGNTFQQVSILKNGETPDLSPDHVRVYDLFISGSSLYATLFTGNTPADVIYELYKYENGVFNYQRSWYNAVNQIEFSSRIIASKVNFGGFFYFTTGELYVLKNETEPRHITMPGGEIVYDLYEDGGTLYALCGVRSSPDAFRTRVYRTSDPGSFLFEEFFEFEYPVPPLSFACKDGEFFIGFGSFDKKYDLIGSVLSVKPHV